MVRDCHKNLQYIYSNWKNLKDLSPLFGSQISLAEFSQVDRHVVSNANITMKNFALILNGEKKGTIHSRACCNNFTIKSHLNILFVRKVVIKIHPDDDPFVISYMLSGSAKETNLNENIEREKKTWKSFGTNPQ